MNKMLKVLALSVSITTLVAGCSSAASSSLAQTHVTSTTSVTKQTVSIEMNEFSYMPATIQLQHGQSVHFILKNTGKVQHDINNDAIQLDADVDPGQTVEYDWIAPDKAGTYEIACDKVGHKDAGMVMTFDVK